MERVAIKKILEDKTLEDDDYTRTLKFALASKFQRQNILQSGPGSDDAKICAAIEIQRCYRGYNTRCRLLNALHPHLSKQVLYTESKPQLLRLEDVKSSTIVGKKSSEGIEGILSAQSSEVVVHPPKESKSVARLSLELKYDAYVRDQIAAGRDCMSFENWCADVIRSWYTSKKDQLSEIRDELSPTKDKEQDDVHYASQKDKHSPTNKNAQPQTRMISTLEAASIIQRAWRRHIDVQVYKYYRDLINFKQRGDPAMMLRCINPNEAKMLDPAAGVHIKFRLAGDRFPPNIYYKIFTHRPIQDLCANSPKDYTKPEAKRLEAKELHNKIKTVKPKEKVGWYQRQENNGWRLVSDRLIHHIMSDPVTWETSNKKIDFHHSKLKRKEDVEKKKKQKKIDWMKKMYKEGMLQAKVTDPDTVDLIEGAAAGMVATIDAYGTQAVQDWEVDELLDWTTSLNFEEYWTSWKETATSANSEKPTEDRFKLTSSNHDPFELTVSKAGRHEESAKLSRNTPASGYSIASY